MSVSNINKPDDAFVFMKIGSHAGETLEQIIERKNREFQETGRVFWGYGGSACHPLQQVQPFVRMHLRRSGRILLVMQSVVSNADPDIVEATEFPEDGVNWQPMPKENRVTGSRYALILDEIKPDAIEIDTTKYQVGIGPSRGRTADKYLKGRIDKACLTVAADLEESQNLTEDDEVVTKKKTIKIAEFSAELKEPYAVLLR